MVIRLVSYMGGDAWSGNGVVAAIDCFQQAFVLVGQATRDF